MDYGQKMPIHSLRALASGQRRAWRRASRLLVVQKTGWGKSFVYFIATKLLRAAGAGPVLLISPLLALMRNQVAAAERTYPGFFVGGQARDGKSDPSKHRSSPSGPSRYEGLPENEV
jgi:superfamily II DNA or RNA helicase